MMIHYFESFYFVVFSVGVCHSAEVHHTVLESVENMSNTHELSALTTKHFFLPQKLQKITVCVSEVELHHLTSAARWRK